MSEPENDPASVLFVCIQNAIAEWTQEAKYYSGLDPFGAFSLISIGLAETIHRHIVDEGLAFTAAPLTELQIRSAVYGCSDGKCLCGRCAP